MDGDLYAAELALARMEHKYYKLLDAVKLHHAQKADDRCIEDDDRLYDAAGLPPCDRRVGNKEEMLKNCKRFIERRCESGGWATYQELKDMIQVMYQVLSGHYIGINCHGPSMTQDQIVKLKEILVQV